MNPFDAGIQRLIAPWVGRVCGLDGVLYFLSDSVLFKGGVPVMILWYLWFNREATAEPVGRVRRGVVNTVFASVLAILVGRMLASALPFRARPIHDEALAFPLACGLSPRVLDGWSSFPSDHAVMFFAVATGILLSSRWLGFLALAHACLVVALPRVYLGFHYPSDVLAGALVGAFITLLVFATPLTRLVGRLAEALYRLNRGLFYAGFFLLSLEMAIMFGGARALLAYLAEGAGY